MRWPSIIPLPQKQTDASSPEASHGGPVYDARMDHTITTGEIVGSERLQQQRNIHLFDSKSAPAEAFSHYVSPIPSPLLGQIASLASARDQIERVTSRRDLPPFPGVELGHVPGFHASPSTTPVLGGVAHLTQGAHLNGHPDTQSHSRSGRRRFGH